MNFLKNKVLSIFEEYISMNLKKYKFIWFVLRIKIYECSEE